MNKQNHNNETQSIQAANESRFEAAHFSEALTAFAVGYKDPENLEALLEFIAPTVPVSRRFEFKRANNAEAFYSETDNDIRAIGGSFKRVEYQGETVSSKTINKGLTMRVDHDEVAQDDWQERYVQILLQRLLRNELRRAIATINTAATSTDATWDDDANPDADLRTMLLDSAKSSGIRPNRILIGENAWDLRASVYEAQENAGAQAYLSFNPKALADKLFVEDVKIFRSYYQSSPSAKSPIVDKAVYAFSANQALSKDEPANLKRFVTPSNNGAFGVYVQESSKYTDLTVEHYSNVVATSDVGLQKLNISS